MKSQQVGRLFLEIDAGKRFASGGRTIVQRRQRIMTGPRLAGLRSDIAHEQTECFLKRGRAAHHQRLELHGAKGQGIAIAAETACVAFDHERVTGLRRAVDLDALPEDARDDHWQIASAIARSPGVLRQAVDSLELSTVAKHAYVLAQSFNSFYHRYKVAQEPDADARAARIAVVRFFHDGMVRLLDTMGIAVPDRM